MYIPTIYVNVDKLEIISNDIMIDAAEANYKENNPAVRLEKALNGKSFLVLDKNRYLLIDCEHSNEYQWFINYLISKKIEYATY